MAQPIMRRFVPFAGVFSLLATVMLVGPRPAGVHGAGAFQAAGDPVDAGAPGLNLLYLGGPVMGDPTVYTIFWLPSGRHFEPDAARDAAYEGTITDFIQELDGSPYFKVLGQYSTTAQGKPIKGGPITG